MDRRDATGQPMAVDTGGETNNDDDVQVNYGVPTNNRFDVLPIPIPDTSTFRGPTNAKPRKPPVFHVFEPALLETQTLSYKIAATV